MISGPATVTDGDSLRLSGLDIRLRGVDAPERGQTCHAGGKAFSCGETARRELAHLVDAAAVTFRLAGRDCYRRRLAQCSLGETDIAAILVARGWAVAYGDYQREEAQARDAKRGLWSGTFDRPSDWRAVHQDFERRSAP